MAIADYSSTAADNTSISGITLSNATVASQVDDIIRQVMADVKAFYDNAALLDGTTFTANPQITTSSPTLTFNDSDTSVTATITSDNAGSLRLRADPSSGGASSVITAEVDGSTVGTFTTGGFNGVVGATTPEAGTFTTVLSQASNPNLSLWDTGASAASKQIRHSYTAGNYDISTYDSSGVRTAVDMRATVVTTGVTEWSYRIEGTERLEVTSSGIKVNGNITNSSGIMSIGAVGNIINFSGDVMDDVGDIRPSAPGKDIGSTDIGEDRFDTIYLVNSPNVSSDARLKDDIADLTEAERRAAARMKTRTFTMKDSGQKKVGYIAQEIEAAMAAEGLDAVEYGLVSIGDDDMRGIDKAAINAFRLG